LQVSFADILADPTVGRRSGSEPSPLRVRNLGRRFGISGGASESREALRNLGRRFGISGGASESRGAGDDLHVRAGLLDRPVSVSSRRRIAASSSSEASLAVPQPDASLQFLPTHRCSSSSEALPLQSQILHDSRSAAHPPRMR
jgi:hypothetical protein